MADGDTTTARSCWPGPLLAGGILGVVFGVTGLITDQLEIDGLSIRTGYVHLRALNSFFYGIATGREVVVTLFLCHFLIGLTLVFALWGLRRIFYR